VIAAAAGPRATASRVALALTLMFAAGGVGVALGATVALPWIQQKTPTECGRAALASLAARGGGDVEAMYRRLPSPPDKVHGYSVAQMQRFGARVGVHLAVEAPAGLVIAGECSPRPPVTAHFRRLASLVAGGTPVVVPISTPYGSGHYLVLTGTEPDGFTALDPGSPGTRRIATAQLAALMCEFGYVALVSR
jgi:hypothetical protein